MLFPSVPQNADDVRAFCRRFDEGIRVEYKSTFDDNVRRALPKVVSSFANSLGGVLIVGVNTRDGVPQNPIEGFVAPAEEFALTVENICLQGINPPVFPRTTVVDSDVPDHKFIVVEVDESWEAPHAIENSKRVYVRTGAAGNPYDLAEVDLIIELVRRRSEPTALRERMLQKARKRAATAVDYMSIHAEASISPLYPRRSLCTRDTAWDFLLTQRYRGGHLFPLNDLRRVEDGAASFEMNVQYGQLNTFGLMLSQKVMQPRVGLLLVGDPLHLMLKLIIMADRFFTATGYKGDVEVSLHLRNIRMQRLVFLPGVEAAMLHETEYRCYEDSVSASEVVPAGSLRANLSTGIHSILAQVCWSFWQSMDAFPNQNLEQYVHRVIREMGQL